MKETRSLPIKHKEELPGKKSLPGEELPTAPLWAHLEELRWTLIRCIIALILCALPFGIFWREVFGFIALWPLSQSEPVPQLIFTAPADALYFIFKIALSFGSVLASPYLFFELWRFAAPGLYKSEKKTILPVVLASTLCFISGIVFCYFFLPLFLRFLIAFAEGMILPMFRVNEYFGFLMRICLVFGLVFELPVVSYVLSKMGIIDHRFLIRYFRHAMVIIFIAAAVLTPPDVLSQILLALPLIFFYCLGILVSRFASRPKAENQS